MAKQSRFGKLSIYRDVISALTPKEQQGEGERLRIIQAFKLIDSSWCTQQTYDTFMKVLQFKFDAEGQDYLEVFDMTHVLT